MWATQEYDIMPAQPGRPRDGKAGGGHNYDSEESYSWTVFSMREDFLSMPERVQRETLLRVHRLLLDELRRGQRQPSALMRMARSVYGVLV